MPQLLNRDGNPIEYKKEKYVSVGFNADLADEVIAVIEAMPERWDQEAWAMSKKCPDPEKDILEEGWSCETGMCFAGWAVAIGHELEWIDTDSRIYPGCFAIPAGEAEIPSLMPARESYVQGMTIAQAATYLLGITEYEADRLFYSGNNLEDIKQRVERLKWKYSKREAA